MTIDPAVQRLIDEAAIRDIHVRYCRGIDRMDWPLVRSCYHDDGIDDHGAFRGSVDDFIAWVTPAVAQFESTTHFCGAQTIEIDGDVAWAERYTIATHRRAASADLPEADLIAFIRYIDRVERRHGEWRIADRRIVVDSQRIDPVGERPSFDQGLPSPKRDRTDPSYER
jgi:hypothetical protein